MLRLPMIVSILFVFCFFFNTVLAENPSYHIIDVERESSITLFDHNGNKITPNDDESGNDSYDQIELVMKAAEHLAYDQVMKAIDVFESKLKEYPGDPWLLCRIGELYDLYTTDIERACMYYDWAYEINPTGVEATYRKGLSCFYQGRRQEALNLLDSIVHRRMQYIPDSEKTYLYEAVELLANAAYEDNDVEKITALLDLRAGSREEQSFDSLVSLTYVYNVAIVLQYVNQDSGFDRTLNAYYSHIASLDCDKIRDELETNYTDLLFGVCMQLLKENGYGI